MTVVYSAECRTVQKANRTATTMLPILVVLFVFSYAILTMLVFEQGQTIESQRGLIREMMKDSSQLAALKNKLSRDDGQQHAAQKMAVPAQQPKEAAPRPSGKESKRAGKSPHSLKQAPGKPASDLEDVRRATRVI